MENSVEFAFYVEKESAISQLNRFMLKEFRHKTHLWSNEASHNIILWLIRGSAKYIDERDRLSLEMNGKVISIKRGSSYIIEADPNSLLLTYSFDDYLPFDTESLELSGDKYITSTHTPACADISPLTYHELGSLVINLGDIRNNESLTFISLQKVMLSMMKTCERGKMAQIFAPLLSRKNEETAKYARLINFNEKNFKKSSFAYNLKV